MKTLKFGESLVGPILSGEKTSTWRVNDDKSLAVDDGLSLVNRATGQEFAKARIVSIIEKTFGEVADEDFETQHERYESPEKMYEVFRGYYGDQIGPGTSLKIVRFVLV